jgi:ribulose-phosphate 3-epimerase
VADAASATDAIHGLGGKAGLALSPGTPLASVDDVLEGLDQLLIMTVEPGAGGHAYLTDMEDKISDARRLIDRTGAPTRIEVDGGITPQTIGRARRAGADVFVAGSFILGHTQGKAAALEQLRQAVAASPRSD